VARGLRSGTLTEERRGGGGRVAWRGVGGDSVAGEVHRKGVGDVGVGGVASRGRRRRD